MRFSRFVPVALIACASASSIQKIQDADALPDSDSGSPAVKDPSPTTDAGGGGGGEARDAGDAGDGSLSQTSCTTCMFGAPVNAGVVSALNEASGLAASQKHAGILYGHNDSGDSARVFMLGYDGSTKARLTITGAPAIDWEDIAVGPCGTESCVFVADIGDNMLNRTNIRIVRFREPLIADARIDAETYPVQYPSGPQDAETLIADGRGALYVLTKPNFGAARLLSLGIPGTPGTTLIATEVGSFTPPTLGDRVTGGDYAACGRLAVRTYGGVYLFEGQAGDLPDALLRRTHRSLASPLELQGESIAFSQEGNALFTMSEGASQTLHRYDCQP